MCVTSTAFFPTEDDFVNPFVVPANKSETSTAKQNIKIVPSDIQLPMFLCSLAPAQMLSAFQSARQSVIQAGQKFF